MAHIVNVKLKNGADIISILQSDQELFVFLENPVQIEADPENGFYAKSWLLLSENNVVAVSKLDIFYVHDASDKAIGYYENFLERMPHKKHDNNVEEFTNELEDIFNAMLESNESTKH